MVEETKVLFDVVYEEKKSSFQLSASARVADLKNKIFQEFGIAPNKQTIECWYKKPSTDADTLITCCLLRGCNFLVVYNEETKHTFGSKEYQQFMLDMLGDRDYDSFDHYEFDLLRKKIGYALYGPPKKETGYEEKELKKIDFLFKKIIKKNNLITKWKDRVIISFIHICMEPLPKEKEKRANKFPDYDPNSDVTPTPVFVLRKCKHGENSCRIFIDDVGRVYSSWDKYLSNNKLPECVMVYPKNGRYQTDENKNVVIERRKSPACDISNDILLGTDIASNVGSIASGGVMAAAAFFPVVAAVPFVVPVAAATGAVVGAYSITRNAFSLHDKRIHQDLSFFKSPEARAAYINIVAGSLGFVGTGANAVVSKLAAEGFHIGRGAATAVNTLNILNISAGGAGIANTGFVVLRDWICEKKTPSASTVFQLCSSILFFGNAVYKYKSVGKIIDESQANYLRKYQDSLRNNQHRKTLTQFLEETIHQNNGDKRKGQAEVISTIKHIRNKDEGFEMLTHFYTKKFTDSNNSNGEITSNGVQSDMTNLSSKSKNEAIAFLETKNVIPKPVECTLYELIYTLSVSDMSKPSNGDKDNGDSKMKNLGQILDTFSQICKQLSKYIDNVKKLDTTSPNNKYFPLISKVSSIFQKLTELEKKYAKWLETRNPDDEEPYFLGFLSLTNVQRMTKIFDIVKDKYYVSNPLKEADFNELLNHFFTWFTSYVHSNGEKQQRRQQRREHGRPATRKSCKICGGYYYSPRKN